MALGSKSMPSSTAQSNARQPRGKPGGCLDLSGPAAGAWVESRVMVSCPADRLTTSV